MNSALEGRKFVAPSYAVATEEFDCTTIVAYSYVRTTIVASSYDGNLETPSLKYVCMNPALEFVLYYSKSVKKVLGGFEYRY